MPSTIFSRAGRSSGINVDEAMAVDIVLQPGEMSLHNGLIVHGSGPNRSNDRRIGYGIRYIPPHVRQTSSLPDSATLVRGTDRYGCYELEPAPTRDFDPEALARHATYREQRHRLQSSI